MLVFYSNPYLMSGFYGYPFCYYTFLIGQGLLTLPVENDHIAQLHMHSWLNYSQMLVIEVELTP